MLRVSCAAYGKFNRFPWELFLVNIIGCCQYGWWLFVHDSLFGLTMNHDCHDETYDIWSIQIWIGGIFMVYVVGMIWILLGIAHLLHLSGPPICCAHRALGSTTRYESSWSGDVSNGYGTGGSACLSLRHLIQTCSSPVCKNDAYLPSPQVMRRLTRWGGDIRNACAQARSRLSPWCWL